MCLQCIKKLVKSTTYPITLSESSCYQAKMLLVQFGTPTWAVRSAPHDIGRKKGRQIFLNFEECKEKKNQTNKQTKQNKTIFNKMTWVLDTCLDLPYHVNWLLWQASLSSPAPGQLPESDNFYMRLWFFCILPLWNTQGIEENFLFVLQI